jgi:proteasome lid subunit RPN8/RPN11
MSIVLDLSKKDYDTMLQHCVDGLPNEACGLIAGTVEGEKKIIKKVYLLTNIDESNEHFSMDPKEQLAAVKDARANGWALIGNFHSHPESPSRPSEEDKRLAYDSSIEYLILSLQEREHPVLKAFGIDKEKNVTIHEIEITDK